MRKGLLFIAISVVMVMIALAWLLSSASGLRTTVSIVERLVPELSIEQVEGRLIGPLTVHQLRYHAEAQAEIDINQIYLDWTPSALAAAKLQIAQLHIDGVMISTQPESSTTETVIALPDINVPVAVELNDFQLSNVQMVDSEGNATAVVDRFSTTLTAQGNQLIINAIKLGRPDVIATTSGNITLQGAYPIELEYDVNLKQVLAEPIQLKGQVKGDMETLTIQQQTSAPIASNQQIELKDILHDLRWSLSANAKALDLAVIVPEQATRFEAIELSANGNLNSLEATLSSMLFQPDFPAMAVSVDANSVDLKTWQVDVSTSHEQSLLRLAGWVNVGNEEPQFDMKANWQNLSWPFEEETPAFASPEGTLMLSGSINDYQARLLSSVNWAEQTLQLETRSHGSTTELTIDALTMNGFDGVLQASGAVNWQEQPLQYLVNANWQDIVLPAALTGKAIALQQGKLQLEGNPEQLSLATSAQLTIDDVMASVEAKGKGDTAVGFEQSSLVVTLADGTVSYNGPLRWAGDTLLDGKLILSKLNPGALMQGWPGHLSGQSAINLKRTGSALQVNASDIAIRGELRQRPLSLTGSVSYMDSLIDISQLELKSGQSLLNAHGQLQNDKLDFNWSLQSPDLQDFYPDLSGSVSASGELAGQFEQPSVNASIKAASLAYQDVKVAKLDTLAKLQLQNNALVSVQLLLENIESPQLDADTLSLTIEGSQQAHDIALSLNSAAIELALKANGELSEQYRWQGNLKQFDFENAKAGSWRLTQKGPISLSANEQVLPRHCWSATSGQVCLQAAQAEGVWQTEGEFAQLPLSLFEGLAVELEQLTGSLRGKFELAADKDATVRGHGDIYVDDASIQLNQAALNQKKPLALNNVSLNYQLDDTQTTATLHLEPALDGVSAIDANIETAALQQVLNNPQQSTLRGQISTAVKDLATLELSHPAFDDVKGQLDINLSLSGTVAQPQIEGEASLQQGQVAVVDAGIILKEIEAKVTGNLDRVDFDLQARSGEGVLTGEGQFRLTKQSWELATSIQGRQLEVMNTPEALVIAEPDLNISVTPTLTLVKGKVHIPEAELEPTEFNSAVSPSRDVVVVSEEIEIQSGAETNVDITVSLGDKVKLKAMGFQGRLTGDLRVFGQTSDILLANGEIKIKDGSYLAYGQLLHVDDGSIRFAGGAVDNPELDITAVRKGKDYQAGLRIQGFASAPQANLFSVPDLAQDDVLSYILLGKPVDQASATDAALLASAATGMGLQNGAMIGDQIASTFGLDEFSIGGDSADNAALQVGKYLSPKLYLSYGIGVFESVSTVELRYELSKIWALKAESGTESGVDLLYTYERGKPEARQ